RDRVTVLTVLMALAMPVAVSGQGSASGEQKKLAQTGMKFLNVSLDARSAALGDAVTAGTVSSSAGIFYNPAVLAYQTRFVDASFGYVGWIADIDYNQASMAFRPAGGRWGVFGVSLMFVDYGSIQGTIRSNNEQGFLDTPLISPDAFALGFGYAKSLTDRFSVGGAVKYVKQDLGRSVDELADDGSSVTTENSKSVAAFDFGILYSTGFESLTFAFSARNFAKEIEYEEESFQLPLTLKIGVAMDITDLMAADMSDMHGFTLSIDAEHPRDFPEQLKIGGEYMFMDTIALRAGYVFPTDEQGINLGVGVRRFGIRADYAYTDFGIFSSVHRLSLSVGI
ncbi:MAG: PorV/PorQ family protein, partial [Rhodothermales bacterium]|nr:PorV/PorQ family protein [Rhodothermales bacterium]